MLIKLILVKVCTFNHQIVHNSEMSHVVRINHGCQNNSKIQITEKSSILGQTIVWVQHCSTKSKYSNSGIIGLTWQLRHRSFDRITYKCIFFTDLFLKFNSREFIEEDYDTALQMFKVMWLSVHCFIINIHNYYQYKRDNDHCRHVTHINRISFNLRENISVWSLVVQRRIQCSNITGGYTAIKRKRQYLLTFPAISYCLWRCTTVHPIISPQFSFYITVITAN